MKHSSVIIGFLLLAGSLRADEGAKRTVDFRRDVQPILARNCVACHNAAKQRGGLRLDDGAAALKGGNAGPVIVPGKSRESYLVKVVAGLDPDLQMPPKKKPPLSADDVGILRDWIDQGANWPKDVGTATNFAKWTHWAFQPIQHPRPPKVGDGTWPRNPIDRFILAQVEAAQDTPSPEAPRTTLIRRLYLDLLGLPPTPDEVDAFVNDDRPGAYERLIERVLSSPHYGERWGRHWLDCARYADSDGYEKDSGRPFAWRYRNWVIDALNRDLPFDQFAIEQLAGDLLPNATTEQKVATGFHRNTLTNREGGVDQEQYRVEAVVDRVNTTAKVFLGVTLGCAQCHDHKYDPFSQRDYYQFFAFFNSDREVDIPAALAHEPPPPVDPKAKGAARGTMAQILALGKTRPTHILIRGDFLRPGVEVQPGTPAILPPLAPPGRGVGGEGKALTRLDLARWIVAPENPLTARVTVNWVWQKYFGRGLVATLEDFGTQGEKPSHPELLDWLASELMRRGWSLKELHRLIVTSATYRQSSQTRPELNERDPLNVLLSRQTRHRLEAEVLRDQALTVSGLLSRTIGGPSVHPPQPPGISELTYAGSAKWVESIGPDRYRRGLYTWFQRTSPYPMLTTFDAPDSNVCVVRREKSNTPLQALTLMNDTVFVECAQALGRRIMTDVPGADRTVERVRHGFRLCLGREPEPAERERLTRLHDELVQAFRDRPAAAAKLLGGRRPAGVESPEAATWVALARMLLNLDEFVTRE